MIESMDISEEPKDNKQINNRHNRNRIHEFMCCRFP